jgi:hypothetical protein
MSEATEPVFCIVCEQAMCRHYQADFGKQIHGDMGGWPIESSAAGVHPDEVPDMKKIDAKHGVPTEYTKDGDPSFTGPEHRRKYMKVHKMHDRNCYY